MNSDISFSAVNEFNIHWRWVIAKFDENEQPFFSHIHDVCEIYVNVSGNVSFVVDNNIYPISRGDIIITKPHEYHHCIYHKKCLHEHFWILFPINGNEHLLSCFLNRESGTGNLISLPDKKREEFLSFCYRMEKCKNQNHMQLEQYAVWIQMLSMLNCEYENGSVALQDNSPKELIAVLNHINENFTSIKTIKQMAAELYMSQSTLGRLFSKHLCIKPYDFIEDKRLAYSKTLLLGGKSVLDACFESGFSDCSHFIVKFKKKFGVTPLQYKNKNL
jgi:AraC-like DNA-binding protein